MFIFVVADVWVSAKPTINENLSLQRDKRKEKLPYPGMNPQILCTAIEPRKRKDTHTQSYLVHERLNTEGWWVGKMEFCRGSWISELSDDEEKKRAGQTSGGSFPPLTFQPEAAPSQLANRRITIS